MKAMIFTLQLAATCFLSMPVSAEPVYENLFNFNDARSSISPENPSLGKYSHAALVQGRDGNFYGTTMQGGEANCGTIFRMTPDGNLKTLIEFTGNGSTNRGSEPTAGLILGNDGNFYGTTSSGGAGTRETHKGFGTIFRMTPAGDLTTLVEFTGRTDKFKGAAPKADLIKDEAGNLYGTTSAGGANNCGSIFKLANPETSSAMKFTTLFEFSGSDGKAPSGSLLLDRHDQALYGTTSAGGDQQFGTVFMFRPGSTKVTTLVSFTGKGGGFKGSAPTAGLVQVDKSGFMGTTSAGGANDFGTVFRITTSGTNLMNFDTQVEFTGIDPEPNGAMNLGRTPTGNLLLANDGTLYGTTSHGGKYDNGTVFRMDPDSRLVTTLVNFTFNGGTDKGASPEAGLVMGSNGIFYGTTALGCAPNNGSIFKMTADGELTTLVQFAGTVTSNAGILPVSDLVKGEDGSFYGTTSGGASDYGTIFRVTPEGILNTLVTFRRRQGADQKQVAGKTPNALCLNKKDGNFYGTTVAGGIEDGGTCFVMTPKGKAYTLFRFTGKTGPNLGSSPAGSLVQDKDGNLYGTTSAGGTYGCGTVFMMKRAQISMVGGKVTVRPGMMKTLVNFTGNGTTNIGRSPVAGLCLNKVGTFLYGTTSAGGKYDQGTIFRIPVIRPSSGWNATTLVNFTGRNTDGNNELSGSSPKARLIPDATGSNFYGTTSAGGSEDCGTVFMMTPDGNSKTLVNFTGNGTKNKGRTPTARLILDRDGSLLGTTSAGGSSDLGTIFRMIPPTKTGEVILRTMVTFTGSSLPTMGSAPAAGLVRGNNGNYYGVTSTGGVSTLGTIFMMTPSGSLTTLAEFTGDNTINKGISPASGLTQDNQVRDGNYFGTTQVGGAFGYGTVFMMTPGGTVTTLVEFSGNGPTNKGSLPSANLLQDGNGDFYGTTDTGGAFNCGTVFRMSKSGELKTLIEFSGNGQTNKGKNPMGGLVLGSDGNFYGTTVFGGTASNNYGTIFRMTPDGILTTIVEFTGTGSDGNTGSAPRAGLVKDGDFLYGTTSAGGLITDKRRRKGNGTIFMTTLSGKLTTLVKFTGKSGEILGSEPVGGLTRHSEGRFFGTTSAGGANDMGTIFMLTTNGRSSGTTLSTKVEFTGVPGKTRPQAKNAGRAPRADLVLGRDDCLYGTTQFGGTFNNGTVFKVPVDGNQLRTLKSFLPYDPNVPKAEGAPTGRLIVGSDGNLYGTTRGPDGSVFRLNFEGAPLVTDIQHSPNAGDGEILEAKVNPRGEDTVVWLDYGTDKDLEGGDVVSKSIKINLSGYQTSEVGTALNDLTGSGPYYYRFRAVQVGRKGTTVSPIMSFSTLSPPSVTLAIPTTISANGESANIRFRAIVRSPENPATVYCEWGTDGNSFPGRTPIIIQPADSKVPMMDFPVLDLKKGVLYYYRIVASNIATNSTGDVVSGGTTVSGTGEFTTPVECIANIGGARVIDANVLLSGIVNPRGSETNGEFQISLDGFKNHIKSYPVPKIAEGIFDDTPVSVLIRLNELDQNKMYSYRMVMTNIGGTVESGVKGFSVTGISGLLQEIQTDPAGPLFSINVGATPFGVVGGWRFGGEQSWRATGTVAGLEQSNRIIEFMPVYGFATPASLAIEISASSEKSFTGHYEPAGMVGSGGLVVDFKPDSVLPTAKWRLVKPGAVDNPWLSASDPLSPTPLEPGSYLVECMPIGIDYITPTQQKVVISDGAVTTCTFVYVGSTMPGGIQPIAVKQNTNPPHAYVGQILSNSGAGSGFVVKPRVVVTAGHVVFDGTTLSYATGLHWYFQRDSTAYEPRPLIPRGVHLLGDYAAARESANSTVGGAPGAGNPDTQNRDAAALFFNEDAGRGGYSGYLASDNPYNEFLYSDALKILAGYPSGGTNFIQGKLYATDPLGILLERSMGEDTFGNQLRIYSTSEISGSPGMSGGPLFVQHEGLYYPAGIYLGGDNQIVVRSIDSDVTDLITRANASSTAGNNHVDGGIIHTSYSTKPGANFAGLKVTIHPEEAREAAKWYYIEHLRGSSDSGGIRKFFDSDAIVPLNANAEYSYSLGFQTVKPFSKPAVFQLGGDSAHKLTVGEILNFEYTYTSPGNALAAPGITVRQADGVIPNGGSSDFGDLKPGSERELSFTIANKGNAELTGLRIAKSGDNESDFLIVQQPDEFVSGPSGNTTFKVRFRPNAIGNRRAVITISSNDDLNSPYVIRLVGNGKPAAAISIMFGGKVVKDGSRLEFGKVHAASTMSLTIKNPTDFDITGLKAILVGPNRKDFTVRSLPIKLAGGTSGSFNVTFRRLKAGIRNATLQIFSNQSQIESFEIKLRANKSARDASSAAIAKAGFLDWKGGSTFDTQRFNMGEHQGRAGRAAVQTVELPDGREYLALSVNRPAGDFDYSRTVEVSPNLVDWYSGDRHTTVMQDDASFLKVRDNTPFVPGIKRYIRLKED